MTEERITQRGRQLADKLRQAMPIDDRALATCSMIARYATTFHRIEVKELNEPLTPLDKATRTRVSKRLALLIGDLTLSDGSKPRALLGGDPRGSVVQIALPAGWEGLHEGFARKGIIADRFDR